MDLKDPDTEALIALGLNSTQAKVYLALLSLGQSKAQAIWKTSKVNRQDIYRTIYDLERKGIVEKLITSPAEFRALPLQDCLATLLKERAQEYDLLKGRAKKLLTHFGTKQIANKSSNEYIFNLIQNEQSLIHKLEVAAKITENSIDILDSFDLFRRRIVKDSELIQALMDKKVKLRVITNKPKEGQDLPKILSQKRNRKWKIELRIISKEPLTTIRIDDRKRVLIRVAAASKPRETPRLYSDNPCLVAVLQDYFERLWNEATEDQNLYDTSKHNYIISPIKGMKEIE